MWKWKNNFSKLTLTQCVQFAEENGLIPTLKLCSYHKSAMTLTKESGQVGKFRCRKSKCRTKTVSRSIVTWFENSRLSLTLIFQMMYAFSEGLTYNQTRKELCSEDCPVLSTRTVADWFDGTHTQRIESQWRGLKQKFRQQQNKQDFTQWLC
ncbi:hypothetical protein HW555_005051 [Spodoptera exigua]|uniref:Uncharacterized protein n=1 Tax=Spodoptera exigua TaxID=7107 RepID=A0A835LBH1_SPOEX|nr:hypothetical protein HW555_005051 [Spodoptera exigua]